MLHYYQLLVVGINITFLILTFLIPTFLILPIVGTLLYQLNRFLILYFKTFVGIRL